MPRTITLNWMDWITLTIVLVSILRGARFGVLAGLADLAILIATFLAAATLYSPVTAWMRQQIYGPLPEAWAAFITFVIIWLGLYMLVGWLARWTLGKAAAPGSRMLGGVLGGIRGLVLVTTLLVVTLAGPFHGSVATDAERSQVAPYLLRASDRIEALLLPALPMHVPRIGPGGKLF